MLFLVSLDRLNFFFDEFPSLISFFEIQFSVYFLFLNIIYIQFEDLSMNTLFQHIIL